MTTPPSTVNGRLERLFEVSRPQRTPDRKWRNSEVVSACRASGRDLSESHLSELRRGIKANPTMRTLGALAWFFDVPVGYFVDDEVAARVGADLERRALRLEQTLSAMREARAAEREAAQDLQRALRESGVTRVAHRGEGSHSSRRADMMRALARALREVGSEDDEQR
ncbi:hypothetical protein ACFU8R_20310 [Pseudonocardia alni]|uniref:hypothetical protein n=1 Tax=Pseudonocardia alni TaxID=33907 RepID=UPI0036B6C0C1